MIENPMSLEEIRFNAAVALHAYLWSRELNGPTHATTRRLASRFEFAQAHLVSALEAVNHD